MEVVISSLVGAIFGLLISLVFEEPLMDAKARLLRRWRRLTRRRHATEETVDFLRIGTLQTTWLAIDGDGQSSYRAGAIHCHVAPHPLVLPPDIDAVRQAVAEQEEARSVDNLSGMWNGPLLALQQYLISRTVPDEELELSLGFVITDYYAFQAIVARLDQPSSSEHDSLTLRERYLKDAVLQQPIPFLAIGFGVCLVVITEDDKLILTRRHTNSGVRPGELDVSVVEGTHVNLDRAVGSRAPDLYRTAIRGAVEELGITLLESDISFLGFGVDIQYYQWVVVGMARTTQTAAEVAENRARGTSGKWELDRLEFFDLELQAIFEHVRDNRIWSAGFAAIYWTLVHQCGKAKVDSVAKQVFG